MATTISAQMVKELRERTGLGMMECKKALVKSAGDIDAAITSLREAGTLKAQSRSSRISAEGVLAINSDASSGYMVELNCETDFVARSDDFLAFAQELGAKARELDTTDVAALSAELEARRQELVLKIGENLVVRRVARLQAPEGGAIATYLHTNGKIGVLVSIDAAQPQVAHDLAMHIAAMNPMAVKPEEIDQEVIERERQVYAAQAAQSDKPAAIQEKMVSGRVQKFLAEVSLVEQAFVRDPDVKIKKLLKDNGVNTVSFARFLVGDGIEKKTSDFQEEVRQAAGK